MNKKIMYLFIGIAIANIVWGMSLLTKPVMASDVEYICVDQEDFDKDVKERKNVIDQCKETHKEYYCELMHLTPDLIMYTYPSNVPCKNSLQYYTG